MQSASVGSGVGVTKRSRVSKLIGPQVAAGYETLFFIGHSNSLSRR